MDSPPLDGWSGQLGMGWDNPNPFALLKTIIHSPSPFKDEWEYSLAISVEVSCAIKETHLP
jgi:hypothetical protein